MPVTVISIGLPSSLKSLAVKGNSIPASPANLPAVQDLRQIFEYELDTFGHGNAQCP